MANFRTNSVGPYQQRGLTFDDVLLVPQYSDIQSRNEVITVTRLGNLIIDVPIVSANMDSVTGLEMSDAMAAAGALGILHRGVPSDEVMKIIPDRHSAGVLEVTRIPSIGLGEKWLNRAQVLRKHGVQSICVDVAHGHHQAVFKMVSRLKELGFENIIAGNVATYWGFKQLFGAGVNIIKVGIGPGSMCTTRVQTGHGMPQLSAILECATAVKILRSEGKNVYLIADGGIRNSGDIVKALAAGADAVMLGQLLAGCKETPNLTGSKDGRVYRGCASFSAQENPMYVEGMETWVQDQGPVAKVLNKLMAGVRSGMSYSGARTIAELQEMAEFIEASPSTVIENGAHGKVEED